MLGDLIQAIADAPNDVFQQYLPYGIALFLLAAILLTALSYLLEWAVKKLAARLAERALNRPHSLHDWGPAE